MNALLQPPLTAALATAPEARPAWLQFEGIAKRFGAFEALAGIDLSVAKGEFLCLLGPSGCGKTTLLRVLAGLERQDAGRLLMGGNDIGRQPPAQRDYGVVFQSYALFPNLNVADNVGYGLRTDRAQKARRVSELLDLVGLAGSDAKYPAQLSGGQQQRVALARALATSPSLLLLDEPLSALDAQVREHLRRELRALQRKLGVTTVMVTHDQEEALTTADTIAVMNAGRIEQVGTPEQIYGEPRTRFVAEFVGQANWLPVQRRRDGAVELAGQVIDAPAAALTLRPDMQGTLFCRPEDVVLQASDSGLLADVTRVDFMGGLRRVHLTLCAALQVSLTADIAAHEPACIGLAPGLRLRVGLRSERLRCFVNNEGQA